MYGQCHKETYCHDIMKLSQAKPQLHLCLLAYLALFLPNPAIHPPTYPPTYKFTHPPLSLSLYLSIFDACSFKNSL